MELTELQSLVTRMQAIANEASAKRKDFESRGETNLKEQALGESLGVSKCLQLLVDDYPAEMNSLTQG